MTAKPPFSLESARQTVAAEIDRIEQCEHALNLSPPVVAQRDCGHLGLFDLPVAEVEELVRCVVPQERVCDWDLNLFPGCDMTLTFSWFQLLLLPWWAR